MFYVSKVSPFFFLIAILSLLLSLGFKVTGSHSHTFFISLVFGFIGTTLVGAMYQIVPNSQNRRLSLSWISYIVFLGVLTALSLLYLGYFKAGSIILFLSYSVFFIHLLLNIRNWMPLTVRFLGFSLFYLLLSSLFLFLHFSLGIVPFQLAIHTLTVGSMLNAIYGVEIAWIPMLLMETLNIRKSQRLFYFKQASTALVLVSFFLLNYKLIALSLLLEVSVALYYIYLIYSLIKQRRMPSPLPYVVKVFIVALLFLPLGFLIAGAMASHPKTLPVLLNLHIDLLVYGFGAFTIFGGMAHLFPRILWNWKFAKMGGKAPAINELIAEEEFPKFLEMSLIFYTLFLVVDVLFYPLSLVAPILYLFILGYFFKIVFLHAFKKIKEVEHGKGG